MGDPLNVAFHVGQITQHTRSYVHWRPATQALHAWHPR